MKITVATEEGKSSQIEVSQPLCVCCGDDCIFHASLPMDVFFVSARRASLGDTATREKLSYGMSMNTATRELVLFLSLFSRRGHFTLFGCYILADCFIFQRLLDVSIGSC